MSEGNYAPIIVSVYDRLDHLKRNIKALLNNRLAAESLLYIVSMHLRYLVLKRFVCCLERKT